MLCHRNNIKPPEISTIIRSHSPWQNFDCNINKDQKERCILGIIRKPRVKSNSSETRPNFTAPDGFSSAAAIGLVRGQRTFKKQYEGGGRSTLPSRSKCCPPRPLDIPLAPCRTSPAPLQIKIKKCTFAIILQLLKIFTKKKQKRHFFCILKHFLQLFYRKIVKTFRPRSPWKKYCPPPAPCKKMFCPLHRSETH